MIDNYNSKFFNYVLIYPVWRLVISYYVDISYPWCVFTDQIN
ncbi:hypothetical protein TRIP_B30012 [uncultured Desulfatiglans sp.]|nr:hypothetical protein TRIP_B30012 [uncultured Desulfatiglans sp.]